MVGCFLIHLNWFQVYWSLVLKELSVQFRRVPKCILDTCDRSKHGGEWLPGSDLNIAECCILPTAYPRKPDDGLAIVWRDEDNDSHVNQITLQELREQVMYGFICLLRSPSLNISNFVAPRSTLLHCCCWSPIVLTKQQKV